MIHAVGATFNIVGLIFFVAVFACFAGVFVFFAALIFKGIHSLLSGPTDARITLAYPIDRGTTRHAQKETEHDEDNSPAAKPSAFFEDAGGVDLEYRGMGVVEDRAGALAVGAAVSKGN